MKLLSFMKSVIVRTMPDYILLYVKKMHYVRMLKNATVSEEDNEIDLKIVRHLINPGDLVVDIGANIGLYTLFLSRFVGEQGCVYSIEPVPITFKLLSHNVKKLQLNNVKLFNCGISDKNGSAVMEVPEYLSGGENFYQAHIIDNGNKHTSLRQFEVNLKTLDSLLFDSTKKVNFVKIDAEGYEYQVVKGSKLIISKSKPACLIEVSGDPEDEKSNAFALFNFFREEGYQPYWFDGDKIHKYSKGDKSTNYFFLTKNHLLQVKPHIS